MDWCVTSPGEANHALVAVLTGDVSREILDWQSAHQLRGVPEVLEVNTFGGELEGYQVQIDPQKPQKFHVPMASVLESLRENSINARERYLAHYHEQRIVHGEGRSPASHSGSPADFQVSSGFLHCS